MEWLDASLHKPTYKSPVLAYMPAMDGEPGEMVVAELAKMGTREVWRVGHRWPLNVTHWMLLPESPDQT